TSWVGYKVHLTETCDDDSPHLLTHVETTPAPVADDVTVPLMHEALAARDLLPGVHLVDTGYVDAQELVSSQQQYGVDLFGPTREDYHLPRGGRTSFRSFPVGGGLPARGRPFPGGPDRHRLDTRQ